MRDEAELPGGGLELFIENLDVTRFGTVPERRAFARFLTEKYENVALDAIIGNSDHACAFIDEYLSFPVSVPRAYYTTSYENRKPWIFGLTAKYDRVILDTWQLVNAIFPQMDNAVVIAGDPYSTKTVYANIRDLAGDAGIPVRLIDNFTFDELIAEVSRASPTTAIFFMPVLKDRTGEGSTPKKLLSDLAGKSPAPIFTFWETMTGSGTVGGYVISSRTAAREMVRAIRDYLGTGSFGTEYTVSLCVLDWTEMERHGLRTDLVPEGATIINRPEPIYVRYARTVMRIANFIFIAFIAVLLVAGTLVVLSYSRLRSVNRQLLVARREAEELSLKDALTGLLNRRAFLPMVGYELQRRNRFGSVASLLIADIDHFKAVNDTYGHDVGDIVLKAVAKSIQEAIRGTDTLARWGGEEFLVLLPDTDELRGYALAEKIRKGVMTLRFERCRPITISVGLAENSDGESFDEWFRRTDASLYRAKQTGRNKTVASSGMQPEDAAEDDLRDIMLLRVGWRDEYRVGVDEYDAQHKDLFLRANGLVNSVVNAEGTEAVLSAVQDLREAIERHFRDEEDYLRKKKCARMERHAGEHDTLLRNLDRNIAAYARGDAPSYAFIFFVCNDLIIKHILNEDKLSFESVV